MPESEKIVYKLYAMPLSAKSMKEMAKARFSRATPFPDPGYILVYTDGEPPKDSAEITKEREELLSEADKTWLNDTNRTIIAEVVERHRPDILKSLSDRMSALEAELKRRKQEMMEKGD